MKILLAGGAVRNLLLGRAVADKDFLVLGATAQEFLDRFPNAHEAGNSFPVFLLNGEEYSFLRAETVDDDLRARDFTINAMLLDEHGELRAHPQALEDLHLRILRPASERAFQDDPLRIYRCGRFLAQMPELRAAHEAYDLARQEAATGSVARLAPERVCKELVKALAGERPGRFLEFLHETGALGHWFEEFRHAGEIPAGPPRYHSGSVLSHTIEIMNKLAGDGPFRVWLAMVHDLGKTTTENRFLPKHHGHDLRGETLARELGSRLRLPNRFITAGAAAARWHMIAARYPELRPGTRVDLLDRLHRLDLVEDLFSLAKADSGEDHFEIARADLETMLSVRLPENERDLGPESGSRLRALRSEAIASLRRD